MALPEPLGVDSDCLVYAFEWQGSERYLFLAENRVARGLQLVVSTLGLTEVMVKWYQTGRPIAVRRARESMVGTPGLTLVDVTADIADRAAEIRAATGLKLPDAVHLATAMVSGAAAFLTNDSRIARQDVGIPILRLDDLVAASG